MTRINDDDDYEMMVIMINFDLHLAICPVARVLVWNWEVKDATLAATNRCAIRVIKRTPWIPDASAQHKRILQGRSRRKRVRKTKFGAVSGIIAKIGSVAFHGDVESEQHELCAFGVHSLGLCPGSCNNRIQVRLRRSKK